jgi:gliding motility-associated-like protein
MKPRFTLSVVLFLLVFSGNGQILYSNGATITMNVGSVVFVNGGVELAQNSALVNNGSITITKNSTLLFPGTLKIGSTATLSGNGAYFIEQDWINNGTFNAGNSVVTLFGNSQQFITSTNGISTVFNDLVLTGSGTGINRKKTLQNVNASTGISGTLQINDRELETQTNSFFVLNPSSTSVTYTTTFGSEGFVSSLSPGVLSRVTNSTNAYIYPTGSSLGTLRFRPVEIVPQINTASEYVVRFNNIDPTSQSFDRAQNDGIPCELNPTYYHSIERVVGSIPADVKLFFVLATDGDWTGISHWRNTTTDWNDMGATSSSVNGGFTTRTKAAWNFTNPGHPYVLSRLRPEPPVLNCPTFCENSSNNLFSLTGSTSSYQWTFPSNGTIVSGQGTANIVADWSTGTGVVSAIAIGANGCNSLPSDCTPVLLPNPNVQFSYTEIGQTFQFLDQTNGAVSWSWSFGDGNNSTLQNPTNTYVGGESFVVNLEVTNAAGCVANASIILEIFQDLIVPNIITPNNDGTNDNFYINASGIKTWDLVIVNRWGNTVFETSDPNVIWDGKTDGKLVDDGVYFYKLKASTITKEYNFQGNVTVISN